MHDALIAFLMVVGAALVVAGVSRWSAPAAAIVAGLVLCALAFNLARTGEA